ncbi:hypothetical protein [Dongia mobilis]|uniref:hypothetical protein n=1 Tax=Dongia mobilis TaxID=578943 RepID=UPI00106077BC|nr:hypothetical protein [Dongia mobilis]
MNEAPRKAAQWDRGGIAGRLFQFHQAIEKRRESMRIPPDPDHFRHRTDGAPSRPAVDFRANLAMVPAAPPA